MLYCNDGRCERVRKGEKEHSHATITSVHYDAGLKQTSRDLTKIITRHTVVRINQELSNVSADELKANALAAIAVIFAILSVSQNWIYLEENRHWFIFLPFFTALGLLVISFIFAIIVLRPRKRFDLWLPRDSNNFYAEKNLTTTTRLIKEELITSFEGIERSRDKDRKFIKYGYILLVFGSIGILMTMLISRLLV